MDDLSGPILFVGLMALLVLAVGCAGLVWWQLRRQPSRAATWAAWAGFGWSFLNLLNLAIIPRRDIAHAMFTTLVWGAAIVAAIWFVGILLQHRRAE